MAWPLVATSASDPVGPNPVLRGVTKDAKATLVILPWQKFELRLVAAAGDPEGTSYAFANASFERVPSPLEFIALTW